VYKRQQKLASLPTDDWKNIYHLVIVPTYKEKLEILESSIESVINSDYPLDKIIYVLAVEERDKNNGEKIASVLKEKYGDKLYAFLYTVHPANIPGEVKGKGANIYFSAKETLKFIDKQKIPYQDIMVTTMDADNLADRKYLANLSYAFITDLDPIHKSYQPLPMYFNNIWDVPVPMRLMAMSSSFWQMVVATQPHLLRNFSAHAQCLEALVATDFWSRKTIVEDGHQFWRSYFAFHGNHQVVPLFAPIYMDAVQADSLLLTLKEQYLQQRRWSWGVSDIPYVFTRMIHDRKIPFWDKFIKAVMLFDSYYNWSTASFILAVVAWYPFVFSHDFFNSIYAYSFPLVYKVLLMLAWVGMLTTLIISTILLPPNKKRRFHPRFYIIRDWIITPIILAATNILFSAVPALESQTRLMFKKYLEFRVTVKSANRSGVLTDKAKA
jgi:cellulose synthase/poly-beta-1,6-N-acetylglucosamine synthase-like glycosyltransferase